MAVSEAITGLLAGAVGGFTASSLTEKKELSNIAQTLQNMASSQSQLSNLAKILEALQVLANERKKLITIYVESTLDQPVSIQILGAPSNPPSSTVPIGTSFTVNPNSADFRTLIPEQSGWTPFITVSLSASTAPTKGYVKVTMFRIDGTSVVIVNNLAITDVLKHDYSTDPNNIAVVSW